MAGTRYLLTVAKLAEVMPTCDAVRFYPCALQNP